MIAPTDHIGETPKAAEVDRSGNFRQPSQPGVTGRLRAIRRWFRRRRRERGWARLRGQGVQIVHVLHVGKTGGTALRHFLMAGRESATHRIELHPHAFTLADVPVGDKVVFFVRDPVTRFASGFWSRFREGRPTYHVPWTPAEAEAFSEFQTPDELATALSSVDPERCARAQAAMHAIGHVRDSYSNWFGDATYFRSRLSDILLIGFTDTMQRSCAELARLLDLPSATLPRDDVATHRRPRGQDATLSVAAIANLRRWYAADVEFVEMCKEITSGAIDPEKSVGRATS